MTTYTRKSLATSFALGVFGTMFIYAAKTFGGLAREAPANSVLESAYGLPAIAFVLAGIVAIIVAVFFVVAIPFTNRDGR